ncbi:hypothetical protein ACEPAH_9566 [Sanghuangporus vaninii]
MSTRVPNQPVGDSDPREDDGGVSLEPSNLSGEHVSVPQLESDEIHTVMTKLIASLGYDPKSLKGDIEPRQALLTILFAIATRLKVLQTSKAGCADCNLGIRVIEFSSYSSCTLTITGVTVVKSLKTSTDVLEPNMSEFVRDVDSWIGDDPSIQWDMSDAVGNSLTAISELSEECPSPFSMVR